jgi:hypothetical protein
MMTDASRFDSYMACFHGVYGFYPEGYDESRQTRTQKQAFDETIIDRNDRLKLMYPDNFYIPTSRWDKGCENISQWKVYRYTPYKRISHFREHLNRLQYCQFVTVPDAVYGDIAEKLLTSDTNGQMYQQVKKLLRRFKQSRYNEHIHYMISKFTNKYISISYDDHRLMCQLFIQLENAFKVASEHTDKRKNIFSYYLIVQLILYVFHYHPHYQLPTLIDKKKRAAYYGFLLCLLSKTALCEQILYMHEERKHGCYQCNHKSAGFDRDLTVLL